MSNVYICYDRVQKDFFKQNGLIDVVYGLSATTLKPFWVFIQTDEFSNIMKKWKSHNV